METAEDGSGDDAWTVFRAADCAAVRRVLREREMRPRRVVVLGVPAQQSAGVALAEDDHKVEQMAPDGADHPSAKGFCQGDRGALTTSSSQPRRWRKSPSPSKAEPRSRWTSAAVPAERRAAGCGSTRQSGAR